MSLKWVKVTYALCSSPLTSELQSWDRENGTLKPVHSETVIKKNKSIMFMLDLKVWCLCWTYDTKQCICTCKLCEIKERAEK